MDTSAAIEELVEKVNRHRPRRLETLSDEERAERDHALRELLSRMPRLRVRRR